MDQFAEGHAFGTSYLPIKKTLKKRLVVLGRLTAKLRDLDFFECPKHMPSVGIAWCGSIDMPVDLSKSNAQMYPEGIKRSLASLEQRDDKDPLG